MQEPLTVEQKLQLRAQVGAACASMLGNRTTLKEGLALLSDLNAWIAQNPVKDELKAGRELLRLQSEQELKIKGPALWKLWHSRAISFDAAGDTPGADEEKWVNENITAQIPCGSCKQHFRGLWKALQPNFGGPMDRGEYFATTVDIHNRVNERIGKPTLTLEEARALYS